MKPHPSLALLVATWATAPTARAEPVWLFDNAAMQRHAQIQQARVIAEANRLVMFPSACDLMLAMDDFTPFSATERPYFALRCRAVSNREEGGLFFTTTDLKHLCDDSYTPFKVKGDGSWQTIVVDLRAKKGKWWKGQITGFRLDPLNPSPTGGEFDLAGMGFFASPEAAQRALASLDESTAITHPCTFEGPTFTAVVPPEALKAGWKQSDFTLVETACPTNARRMVCCDGAPVPSCVNSRGYAWYNAARAGRYTLEPATDRAVALPEDEQRRLGCAVEAPLPRSHFTRERIRLGGWGLMGDQVWREEKVRDFAACGMDFLIANTLDSSIHRANLLRACNALGVEVILSTGESRAHPERAGLACADQPSYSGHQLIDEPGSDRFAALGACARTYRNTSGRLPFINLLPMYANAAQLKYGARAAAIEFYDADPALYRKYCAAFCEAVDVPYLSTDIYPLRWNAEGRRIIYRDYVESINLAASEARRRNREFWCYVLCYDKTSRRRDPSVAEIRWQCYAMLSFGCRNIMAWIYYHLENPAIPGLVTREGRRTPAWYNTRTVFREVRRLSDAYCRYRNLGAFTHNASDATPYLKMTNELKGFAPIRRVNCPDPLLIGCFEGADGGAAFTLVNMSDPGAGRTTIAELDLGERPATLYRNGAPRRAAPDGDGLVRIPLETGEGVFVTL